MIRQSDGDGTGGDIASEVGNEIKVTLDRWSVGQLGVSDLIFAGAVVVGGALLAWVASRVAKRVALRYDGAARTAVATVGLLLGSSIVLLAVAMALEVLGFSLGPVLVLILLVVSALLLLRPLMTNLSSALLLQIRGALAAGDLILTNGVLGTVHEINARTVVLDTSDGRRLHVPNSHVLDGTIENYSSLGRRRSSFDVMVDSSVDLEGVDGVKDTVRRAVGSVNEVFEDPPPSVRAAGVVGHLVVWRVFIWHEPDVASASRAIDGAVSAVVDACGRNAIELDGPQWMAVDASTPGVWSS